MIFNIGDTKDAKTLEGMSPNTNGKKGIATILSDYGIMEVGRMIDFHNADSQDFIVRLAVDETTGKLYITNNSGSSGYITTESDFANYLKSDGGNGWVNSVSDLNNFYTGITLTNSSANVPDDDWWMVIAGGVYGTSVQMAHNLWGSKVSKFRFCAAEVWSEWFDLNKDYLPLNGSATSEVSRANGVSTVFTNTVSGAKTTVIGFKNTSDGVMGHLGMVSKDTPCFINSDKSSVNTLLHTGNSSKVVISDTAPSDTSALWVDTSA